jgi:xanthine/uracil permease
MRVINWIRGAFEANNSGASARKLSAFAVIVLVVVTHVKWFKSDRWEYLSIVLGMDYTFILVCLGLATWQLIKENKDKDEQN